ncbi:hypothetical protein [Frondihabitans cladoniiphilus]|uniref:Transmembrane protein n=1 Tax=Frondihabitans cladoniiphilus TaxID=715785 RepID=A0ABP8VIU9_9MICO
MWLRRGFYRVLWGAVLVLPLWVFLGRAFFGAPLGYQFLAQILLVPLLFVGQLVVSLILFLRPSVRRDRAVSWLDVGALTLSWLGQLGIGFFLVDSVSSARASAFTALVGRDALPLSTALSAAAIVLTVVMGVVLLALGVAEAIRGARAGMQKAFADLEGVSGASPAMPSVWANDPKHTIVLPPRA